MKSTAKDSPALAFLSHAWTHSRYPSHRQKNATMQSALDLAITAGMTFHEKDIQQIYFRFRADYWIGGSAEGYYSTSIESGNTSACLAWEQHFGRPLLLWQEDASGPERLHIGSQITWKGCTLKVTSFNDEKQHLIACGEENAPKPDGFIDLHTHPRPSPSETIGRTYWSHDTSCYVRVIDHKETPEGVTIRVTQKLEGSRDKVVNRRITIPYADLLEERKKADARLRATQKRIKATTSLAEHSNLAAAISAEHRETPFRHFDLEVLNDTLIKHRTKLAENLSADEREKEAERYREQLRQRQDAELQHWLAGHDVEINYFNITPHRLRIHGAFIEVTNGNRVPLSEARTTLAFAKRHRKKGWSHQESKTAPRCGGHPLKEITSEHVIIGCTTLLWQEIDRITPAIQAA